MGVCTICYSVPAEMMKKIKAKEETFNFVLDRPEEFPAPTLEKYDFDEHIDEIAKILRGSGFEKTAKKMDGEHYWASGGDLYLNHEGCDVWIIPPAEVKSMAKEIESATYEGLKSKGVAQEVTDYDGELIPEEDYEGYVGNIDELKAFYEKAAEQGNYLVFATQ